MTQQVLFIQGGGEDGYAADEALVISLSKSLGEGYEVNYPEIESDEDLPDFGWPKQIIEEITQAAGDLIVVGHSLGASMILKVLSEHSIAEKLTGVFLLATPYWAGNEDWKAGLKLQPNFAEKLPGDVAICMYHCRDDEEVPFAQFEQYKVLIPAAHFRELAVGDHQFNHDLSFLADDIKGWGLPQSNN